MKKSESKTQSAQRSFGWNLLMNENAIIRRGNDSIVIAGMENEGQKHFPRKGDIKKTMKGIGKDAFVIMLQHDPTAWKTEILPQTNAQLTVSGHTHGGQVSLFGLHAAEFSYDE
jgi:predicted MPP superfamily phosphohydrolase